MSEDAPFAPDWYETASWLATLPHQSGGEVRLYRAVDGRYFLFQIESGNLDGTISLYPTGHAQELTVQQARAEYHQAAERLVSPDEAFPE